MAEDDELWYILRSVSDFNEKEIQTDIKWKGCNLTVKEKRLLLNLGNVEILSPTSLFNFGKDDYSFDIKISEFTYDKIKSIEKFILNDLRNEVINTCILSKSFIESNFKSNVRKEIFKGEDVFYLSCKGNYNETTNLSNSWDNVELQQSLFPNNYNCIVELGNLWCIKSWGKVNMGISWKLRLIKKHI